VGNAVKQGLQKGISAMWPETGGFVKSIGNHSKQLVPPVPEVTNDNDAQ
jgi:hypothetical protein